MNNIVTSTVSDMASWQERPEGQAQGRDNLKEVSNRTGQLSTLQEACVRGSPRMHSECNSTSILTAAGDSFSLSEVECLQAGAP